MSDPTDKYGIDPAKLEKYRQRMAAKQVEIKSAIAHWLEPRDCVADNVEITGALLELALDRHVAVHVIPSGPTKASSPFTANSRTPALSAG
jgi:hypothetical protein